MKHEYHESTEALERFERNDQAVSGTQRGAKPTAKKAVRKRTIKAQKGSTALC